MSSFADSSSDEWDDLFVRIKTRCEKSAMKRTLKPDLCSQLSKLEINEKNTASSDDGLKTELISAIKGVFDGQPRKGASFAVSDEEDEVILTKTARARILSSSDEASESSESGRRSHNGYSLTGNSKTEPFSVRDQSSVSEDSSSDEEIVSRCKTARKFVIESDTDSISSPDKSFKDSEEGKLIEIKSYVNHGYSSDDDWNLALSARKSSKKNVHSTKSASRPKLDTPRAKRISDSDPWIQLVSPERRNNTPLLISASSRKLFPLMTSPNENSENTYDFGKQSKKSQACKSNFESPLPPSAIFSKYSAQSDPSSVLRKLGIDFDLSAKPDEKLYCSNKKLMTIFAKIDKELFGSALTNNQVDAAWSGRLTKAAGITHYKTKLLMVECDIKLSRPLLKLRPAKDMVETLVHEMIHAYLAVTRNPGHKGHGPEFKKQMARVNQMTGLTITIYHSFHDEVDAYRNQNVWRCDGVCRSLRDFKYGYVRRAINRAPGAHEFWWKKHQQLCGGNFERVYKHPFSNHLENQI